MRAQRSALWILIFLVAVIVSACAPIPPAPVATPGAAAQVTQQAPAESPLPTTVAQAVPAVEPITTAAIIATTGPAATAELPVAATPVVTDTQPISPTIAPAATLDPSQLTTYSDQVGGFAFDYPATWSLFDVDAQVKQESLGYSVTVTSWQQTEPGGQGIPEGGSKIDVGVTKGTIATEEDAVEARRQEITRSDTGAQVTFEEPWELDSGLTATRWSIETTQGDTVNELVALINGNLVVVSGLGDPALFEQIAMTLRPLAVATQAKQGEATLAGTPEGDAARGGAGSAVLAGTTYTVRAGDTLANIAARFGVTVQAILRANPQIVNRDRIYIGQRITIPTGGTQPPPAPTTQRVNIYMIGIGGGSVGCGDQVVAVRRDIPKTPAVLTAALKLQLAQKSQYYGESGLYNALYQSNLTIGSISRSGSAWTIRLNGTLVLGGVCDGPRVKAQLEQTALQFSTVGSVRYLINGQSLESLISGR